MHIWQRGYFYISYAGTNSYSLIVLITQIKSLDITTLDRLNLRNANPVGILAGRELQNGFEVDGSTTTSISSSTEIKFKDHIDSTISILHLHSGLPNDIGEYTT